MNWQMVRQVAAPYALLPTPYTRCPKLWTLHQVKKLFDKMYSHVNWQMVKHVEALNDILQSVPTSEVLGPRTFRAPTRMGKEFQFKSFW